jgi:quinol monooxygenase YgiN
MVVVIAATIHVAEGKGEQFEKGYLELAPKVLRDPGAIAYVLHRDNSDPCKFFFYEKYESDEAAKYHTSTPHFKEFFQTMGPIMKGRPEISWYTEVT